MQRHALRRCQSPRTFWSEKAWNFGLLPTQSSFAMNFNAVTLGRKQYAAALVVTNVSNPVILIGGAPFACGITKMLSSGFCVPIIGSFALGFILTAPANSLSFTQCLKTNSY